MNWRKLGILEGFTGTKIRVVVVYEIEYLMGMSTTSGIGIFSADLGPLVDAVCLIQKDIQTGYNAAGNVVSTTDALGRETTYEYDRYGRLVSQTAPDPEGDPQSGQPAPYVEYAYNADGSLRQMVHTGRNEW